MGSQGAGSSSTLALGTVLGAYEIGSILGRGGFGVVYKALHRDLGTEVAIKEFFPSELAVRVNQTVQPNGSEHESPFEDGLRRFLEEAKRLEAFRDCPSIVTCRDLLRANGTAYVVMDHVDGLPLSTLLERREESGEPFTEQDLLDVILPLLAGLQVVHESGVYHRDIKPSNILIRRADSQPVLIDFGAAKQATAGLTKSFAPYTDGYAAMEQVGEGDIGPWTDIYGVGAVMWRMVAGGAPPFSPPNPVPVQHRAFELMQGKSDPLPSADSMGRGTFSTEVLQAIDNCLAINISERTLSCTQLLEEISESGRTASPSGQTDLGVEYTVKDTKTLMWHTSRSADKSRGNRRRRHTTVVTIGAILFLAATGYLLGRSSADLGIAESQGDSGSVRGTELEDAHTESIGGLTQPSGIGTLQQSGAVGDPSSAVEESESAAESTDSPYTKGLIYRSEDSQLTPNAPLHGADVQVRSDSSRIMYGCSAAAGELAPVLMEWVYLEFDLFDPYETSYPGVYCRGDCIPMQLEWDGVGDEQIVVAHNQRFYFWDDAEVIAKMQWASRLKSTWPSGRGERSNAEYDISAAGDIMRDRRQACLDWLAANWRQDRRRENSNESSDNRNDFTGLVDHRRIVRPSTDSPLTPEARVNAKINYPSWIMYGCELETAKRPKVLREWVYAKFNNVYDPQEQSYSIAECQGECFVPEIQWDGIRDDQVVQARENRFDFRDVDEVIAKLEESSTLRAKWKVSPSQYGLDSMLVEYDVSAAGDIMRDRRQACLDWSEITARKWRRTGDWHDTAHDDVRDFYQVQPFLISPIIDDEGGTHWLAYEGCGENARISVGSERHIPGGSAHMQWAGHIEEMTLSDVSFFARGGNAVLGSPYLYVPSTAVPKIMASRMIRVQVQMFSGNSGAVVLDFDTSDARRAIDEACGNAD